MADKKITKKDNFNEIITILESVGNSDLADVMRHEIELINKKNASKKTDAKKAEIDSKIIEAITDALISTGGGTVTELSLADTRLSLSNGVTTQKVSAILKVLVDSGKVNKAMVGKKAIFTLV